MKTASMRLRGGGLFRSAWARVALVGVLLALLASGMLAVVYQAQAHRATLTVCLSSACSYHSINDALPHANPGDTIAVAKGTYTPASETTAGATMTDTTILINKAISLRGAGQNGTILNDAAYYSGSAADSGIVQIRNPGGNVTISGFTFEGAITNDANSCCDDGMFISMTDSNAADTISVSNNKFFSNMALDPQLLGDQTDSIYIYDGNAAVSVEHNAFYGVFRAALIEGYLGRVTIKDNDINSLHGLYDITTTPPTLYYWPEAIFFLVDNNADVTAPQVVAYNTFEHYSGEGVAVDAGYSGGLVGAMHNLTIDGNDFDNGGIAGAATPDSPDIYLHAFGFTSGSLVAEISGVTIKNNSLNLHSDTGSGTGIWLRGAISSGNVIHHNVLNGSGAANPPNGILFQGVADYTDVNINRNLITGFGNGINTVADPNTPDQPPLGTVALPTGANVVVSDNCIAGNTIFGATNAGPTSINAEGNWWGATTGPNTAGADNVGPNVDATHFLTHPASTCQGFDPDRSVHHVAGAHHNILPLGQLAGHFRKLDL